MNVAQGALLAGAVVLQLACAVGILAVEDPMDRLHLIGPVSVLGSVLLVVAIAVGGTSGTHLAKVAVTGLFLWATSPFLTRATARALRIRATGRLEVSSEELGEGDEA